MNNIVITPTVGMGATVPSGSDRYPYTIITVSADKKMVMAQQDNFTATSDSDYYSNQKYTYSHNPKAAVETFTLRKNGQYVKEGESLKNGTRLWIGERTAYQDPSF